MANYGIVIGINQYDGKPEASLKGAVHDALEMRKWLTSWNGGNLLDQNLFVLLSPAATDNAMLPEDLQYFSPPTHDHLISIMDRIVQQSGGQGERLFFYYAGHGLSVEDTLGKYQQALILSDFTDQFTTRSLSLEDIVQFFDRTRFLEQFFFIDACRNIPWDWDHNKFRIFSLELIYIFLNIENLVTNLFISVCMASLSFLVFLFVKFFPHSKGWDLRNGKLGYCNRD